MAIPGIPNNFYLQTANGQNYLLWDIAAGATSYSIQRSTDGVNFSSLTTTSVPSYLDTTATVGTQYWYQVASVNVSGTSPYTAPQTVIPARTAEMSLMQLRQACQQKADRVNSNFVTLPEWNTFINLALYELYDLLITAWEDYFLAPPIQFYTNGTAESYPLPDGVLTFKSQTQQDVIAPAFYKLMGVDLGLNTANNAFVTLNTYEFANRNQFVFPNSTSTIYGVFNLRYRVMGNNIWFIPVPSGNQNIQLWYIPRLPALLQESDMTTLGFSGWLDYVIIRAAKYALDKEESDTSKLDAELLFLKERIENSSIGRDAGAPQRVADVRQSDPYGYNGPFDLFKGGF